MESQLSLGDRLTRSLFVALAVGLAWGIRGDFGHVLGAMYPGAILGLAFAYVTGQRSMFRWMPVAGAFAGLFIAQGGRMSYGVLHGYAKSDTFINFTYGFFTLLLQGGAWGAFGCAVLALMLDKKKMKTEEWASLTVTVFVTGWLFYHLVCSLIGFRINPPRSDLSIGYTGGVVGMLLWLWWQKKAYGFKGALLGYMGFGLGMSFSRMLANATYLDFLNVEFQRGIINHWNVMEVGAGFFGGLIFTFGMLGKKFDDMPDNPHYSVLSAAGILYCLALIPLFHRLRRISSGAWDSTPLDRIEQWTSSLTSFGHENPEALANRILTYVNGVCVLAFIAAAVWYVAWRRNDVRFAPFPVLALSLIMILIQNLNALFFWYPGGRVIVNMHVVFWIIFVIMCAMAAYWTFVRPLHGQTDPDEVADRISVRRVAAIMAGVFLITILAAFITNGEKTMQSANTRFPIWNWRDGPFPGRD